MTCSAVLAVFFGDALRKDVLFFDFFEKMGFRGKTMSFFTKKQSRLNSEGRFLFKKKYLKF